MDGRPSEEEPVEEAEEMPQVTSMEPVFGSTSHLDPPGVLVAGLVIVRDLQTGHPDSRMVQMVPGSADPLHGAGQSFMEPNVGWLGDRPESSSDRTELDSKRWTSSGRVENPSADGLLPAARCTVQLGEEEAVSLNQRETVSQNRSGLCFRWCACVPHECVKKGTGHRSRLDLSEPSRALGTNAGEVSNRFTTRR